MHAEGGEIGDAGRLFNHRRDHRPRSAGSETAAGAEASSTAPAKTAAATTAETATAATNPANDVAEVR